MKFFTEIIRKIFPSKPNKAYLGLEAPNNKFRAFNRTSFWNTKIGEYKEDPFSVPQIVYLKTNYKVLKMNVKNWTIPVHYIDSRYSRKVSVITSKLGDAFHGSVDPKQVGLVANIPVPKECWADTKTDSHMCIVDTFSMKAYDFSKVNKLSLSPTQCNTFNVWDLNSDAYRDPFSGKSWWKNGSRGSGAPLIAGLVLIGDM